MLPDRFHCALFHVYLANLQTLGYCHEQLLHVLLSQVNNLTTQKKVLYIIYSAFGTMCMAITLR